MTAPEQAVAIPVDPVPVDPEARFATEPFASRAGTRQSLIGRRRGGDAAEVPLAPGVRLTRPEPPPRVDPDEWTFAEDRTRRALIDAVRSSGTALALLFAAALGVSGLVAAAQLAAFLQALDGLPTWAQRLGYAAGGTLAFAVMAAFAGLAWQCRRLRASPRVARGGLARRPERGSGRRVAAGAPPDAEAALRALLETYPTDDGHRAFLRRCGLDGEQGRISADALLKERTRLLARRGGGSRAWIEDFDRSFLGPLDAAADRQLAWRRKLVGVKTALAPAGLMDALIVLANSWLLVRDLCVIYDVRAGGWDPTWLLTNALLNAAAAGRIEDATTSLADLTREIAAEAPNFVGPAVAAAAGLAFRETSRRLAEGAANAILLGRLGRIARDRLRPVRSS